MPFGGPMSITRTVCCPTERAFKVYGSKCTEHGFPEPVLKTPCTIRVVGPTGSGYDETAHADSPGCLATLPMPTVHGTYTAYADIDPPLDGHYDQGTQTFEFGTYPYTGIGYDVIVGVSITVKSDRVCEYNDPIWHAWSVSMPRTLHATSRYGSSELTYGGLFFSPGCGYYYYSSSIFNPEANASCGGGTGYARIFANFNWDYAPGPSSAVLWSMNIGLVVSSARIPIIEDTKCGFNTVMGSFPFNGYENTYLQCKTVALTGTPEDDISAEAAFEIYDGFLCNDSCVMFDGTRTTEVTDTITVTS